jgi:hypothetical protein
MRLFHTHIPRVFGSEGRKLFLKCVIPDNSGVMTTPNISRRITVSTLRHASILAQDLSAGNTTKLVQLLQKVQTSTIAIAQRAYAFLTEEVDEHAPIVRETLTDGWEKLNQMYQQHVAKAAWVGPLLVLSLLLL